MAISSDFRMGQHRDDHHEEDAPHFTNCTIFSEGEVLEIGSVVHTTLNGEVKSGMLLCSSGMGLTVLDLFNDIFIDQNDIRFFIEQHGLTPSTSSSGTIIQAYLIFCHMAAENNNMPIFDLIKRNQV